METGRCLKANSARVQDAPTNADLAMQQQVVTEYYLPATVSGKEFKVGVGYDLTEVAPGQSLQGKATVEWLDPRPASTVVVELGLPPGLTPDIDDLETLVNDVQIARYELDGRHIVLYLRAMKQGDVRTLRYRLLAQYPVRALIPATYAYDYYSPERHATTDEQEIVVTLGAPDN